MGESEERVVNLPLSHEINQPSTPQKSAKGQSQDFPIRNLIWQGVNVAQML